MKKGELEAALMATMGNITVAARRLGVDRGTVYRAIERFKMQDVLEQAREKRLDMAESTLDKLMQEGNVTAVIFFLKTQGQKRGYIERKEIEHSGKIQVPQWRWEDEDEPENDAGT